MAGRYWVGGTGTWDATNTTNWSAANGGAGGASVPTSADSVFINANSGTSGLGTITLGTGYNPVVSTMTWSGWNGTVAFGSQNISLAGTGAIFTADGSDSPGYTVTGTPVINLTNSSASSRSITARVPTEANSISFNITAGTGTVTFAAGTSGTSVKNLDFTGFSGTLSCGSNHIVYGNLTFSSGMTVNAGGASADGFTFSATSGTQTITSNGQTLSCQITVNGVGGTVQLADDFTLIQAGARTNPFTLTNGTFNANGKNVSLGVFDSNNANTRTLTMGSGTWTLSGYGSGSNTTPVWDITTTTGLTFNANTANIVLSDTTTNTRYFNGGALAYNKLTIGGTTGSSILVITGVAGQSFTEIASTKTVAHTVGFAGPVSLGNWTVTGSAIGTVTVKSTVVGTQRVLTYTGNIKSTMDYMSFTDIGFSYTLGPSNPYLVYAGANSTNGGNNSGIIFISGQSTAYLLTSGTTWTVPADWSSTNNSIYMIGAGGGGGIGVVLGNNRAAGGGGGGGGYRVVTNQVLNRGANVPYTIGTSTVGSAGGDTTFNTTNIAGGGSAGTASGAPTSAGGAGGTGTYAGGTGGAGAFGTLAGWGYGSGGGGGAGGPLGVGGTGGPGLGSSTATNNSGGGGGGNGGGSNGAIGTSSLGGNGGNNASGVGGAIGSATVGASGTVGGGGAGGNGNLGTGGNGGSGEDILGVIGGAGGKGGTSSTTTNTTNTGLYGGGGSGGYVTTTGIAFAGSAGSQGMILVVYTAGIVQIGSGFTIGPGFTMG
jgi:hypothetical protein